MYNANNVAGNTFYGYKNDNHNVFAEQTDAPEEYYDMLDEILTPEQNQNAKYVKNHKRSWQ